MAAALPAGADASWPGVNGRVSLTQRVPAGEVRANRDIFAYPLGTDAADARRRLTTSTNNEEQSSWSPDGQWIAFKQLDDVWVVRWDGTELKQLTDFPAASTTRSRRGAPTATRSSSAPTPTCTGERRRHLGDERRRHGPAQARRAREGDERYPSMSPDGKKLLFRGDWDGISGNGDEEIFTADADGTRRDATDVQRRRGLVAELVADGTRIALQVAVDGVNQEIYVMNADGSNRVRLTNDARSTSVPRGRPTAG